MVERRILQLEIERVALAKETDAASLERLGTIEEELERLKAQASEMREHWEAEKEAIDAIRTLKEELEGLRAQAERETDLEKAAEIRYGRIPELERRVTDATAHLDELQRERRMLKEEVLFTEEMVTSTDWTSYEVLRFAEHPEVTPIVVHQPNEPSTGAGEEAMCAVADAAGHPRTGDERLRVVHPPAPPALGEHYVVVHPTASVPARAIGEERAAEHAAALAAQGWRVVVTGAPGEEPVGARVTPVGGVDLTGRTSFAELAGVLSGAAALVVGNTGPAHLAAAVGTPVVSVFAPVVPWERWRPWGVPTVRLGDQEAACRLTRARTCPVSGHPCTSSVSGRDVVDAVRELAGTPAPALEAS